MGFIVIAAGCSAVISASAIAFRVGRAQASRPNPGADDARSRVAAMHRDVVHGIATAKFALELGDRDEAERTLARTLTNAQHVTRLIAD